MALVDVAVAELLVVMTEGWVGYYQRVIETTSDTAGSGQKSHSMLHNVVQMVTATHDNANT